MKAYKNVFQLLILLFLFSSCASAQIIKNEGESDIQIGDELIKKKILIYNSSNSSKNIMLGSSDEFVIYKLNKKEHWISNPFKFDPIFKIRTGDKTISYRLTRGNRYILYWNSTQKYWDLYLANPD